MKRFAFLTILGVTVALGGCGGKGEEHQDSLNAGKPGEDYSHLTEVPLDQLASLMGKVSCARIFSCCNTQEQNQQMSLFNPAPKDQAECVTTVATILGQAESMEQQAVDAGRVLYHPDRAAACIKAMDGATCHDYFTAQVSASSSECKHIFEGKVASGGDCLDDSECAGTNVLCQGKDPSKNVMGKCVASPSAGQACIEYACAEGLYCKADAQGNNGTCTAQDAKGTACDSNYACATGYCDVKTKQCADRPSVCDGT
jgi:hypothetical protein